MDNQFEALGKQKAKNMTGAKGGAAKAAEKQADKADAPKSEKDMRTERRATDRQASRHAPKGGATKRNDPVQEELEVAEAPLSPTEEAAPREPVREATPEPPKRSIKEYQASLQAIKKETVKKGNALGCAATDLKPQVKKGDDSDDELFGREERRSKMIVCHNANIDNSRSDTAKLGVRQRESALARPDDRRDGGRGGRGRGEGRGRGGRGEGRGRGEGGRGGRGPRREGEGGRGGRGEGGRGGRGEGRGRGGRGEGGRGGRGGRREGDGAPRQNDFPAL